VSTFDDRRIGESGLTLAFRRLGGPVLLVLGCLGFAGLIVTAGFENGWDIGFDFRGTLWEPARSLLHGGRIYPEPVRSAVVVGNPAVYPPLFILLTVPLAPLSSLAAAWIWMALLAASLVAALHLLGVRDWRCHLVALSSPVVLQGLVWGNLTLLLILPLAAAWRWRDRAGIVGLSVGAAIAAKLFVLPLVAWLVFTRRFRATALALLAAAAFVVTPWLLVGFDGLRDYPALLREVQDVYAVRSASLASVLGGFGLSVRLAVALSIAVGLGLIGVAWRLAGRRDGDRRAFALVITACIVASPIVWPNYSALLLVPIAVSSPRLAPVWFFGYASWLAGWLPNAKWVTPEPCCRPADVAEPVWALSHAIPVPWYAAGMTSVVLAVGVWCAVHPVTAGGTWRVERSGDAEP